MEIISLPWRNYAAHLRDNLTFRLPQNLNLLIQDELNHPSLLRVNSQPRRYPIISMVHHLRCSEQRPGWQNRFYRTVEKRYLNSVDGFIFNSQTTKRVVRKLVERSKPEIVAYPPTDRFGHPMSEEEVTIRAKESRPLKLLYLGNIIHRKGLHTLLEAIHQKKLEVRLDVIGGSTGEPNYAADMQKRVKGSDLKSKVTFHGPMDGEKLAAKLTSADVLVVPSSYEGFGIVYLEGMAFGLPAIGTTAGAATEIITDGETGFLVEPDDSKTLAEHLSRLANDRKLLARMSVNALERYRQQPTWEETARRIREFLHGVGMTWAAKQSSNNGKIHSPTDSGSN